METPNAEFVGDQEVQKVKERYETFPQFHPFLEEIPRDLRNSIEVLPNIRRCISVIEMLEKTPQPCRKTLYLAICFAGLSAMTAEDKIAPGENVFHFAASPDFLYADEWKERFIQRKQAARIALVEFYCVIKATVTDDWKITNAKFRLEVRPNEESKIIQAKNIKARDSERRRKTILR